MTPAVALAAFSLVVGFGEPHHQEADQAEEEYPAEADDDVTDAGGTLAPARARR